MGQQKEWLPSPTPTLTFRSVCSRAITASRRQCTWQRQTTSTHLPTAAASSCTSRNQWEICFMLAENLPSSEHSTKQRLHDRVCWAHLHRTAYASRGGLSSRRCCGCSRTCLTRSTCTFYGPTTTMQNAARCRHFSPATATTRATLTAKTSKTTLSPSAIHC